MNYICKGTLVVFELTGGETIKPPGADALLHRASGGRFVYCGPFDHEGAPADDPPKEAVAYLGRRHRMKAGSAEIPTGGPWSRIGVLHCIYYKRGGTKAPGKFHHEFNKAHGTYRIVHVVKGKGSVVLAQCGRWYRMSFPNGALIDDRGFVWP